MTRREGNSRGKGKEWLGIKRRIGKGKFEKRKI